MPECQGTDMLLLLEDDRGHIRTSFGHFWQNYSDRLRLLTRGPAPHCTKLLSDSFGPGTALVLGQLWSWDSFGPGTAPVLGQLWSWDSSGPRTTDDLDRRRWKKWIERAQGIHPRFLFA
jgi:hypothetical protein